jgi:hypothetical protein
MRSSSGDAQDRATRPGLATAIGGLLGGLGVAPSAGRDAVDDTVASVIAKSGLEVSVVSLRWGCLLLSADAPTAALLRYQLDLLRSELELVSPGTVREIVIRVTS